MNIIDRYVSRSIFVTSAFAIGVISLVLVVFKVFKELLDVLVNHDIPIETVLTFIAYILPFSLTFTIPWGFLTAVLLVFGKMSAENELIALRSNGVSMPRICAPLAVFAILFSGTCLWINNYVAPRAQQQMKDALTNIATNNPLALFGGDQVIEEFPGRKIYIGSKHGQDLSNLFIYEMDDSSRPMRVVQARHGHVSIDQPNKRVILRLADARFEERDENSPKDLTRIRQGIRMKSVPFEISLEELYEKSKKQRRPSQMTLTEMLRNDGDQTIDPARASFEISKRISFSMASIAFALLGVPFAITAHRRETSIGFLFSIVLGFAYFLFIIIADMLKDNPAAHPELLVWLPNVLFTALGLFLFLRLSRR